MKICRVNKTLYLVKNKGKIVKECSSFKEARNVLLREELKELYKDKSDLEDMSEIFKKQAVA